MKKTIIYFIAVILVLVAGFWLYYGYQINSPLDRTGDSVIFSVEQGDGAKKIAARLQESGIIRSAFFFETYLWQHDLGGKLQAGDYSIEKTVSISDVATILTQGNTVSRERTVKFIEGWRLSDMDKYLQTSGFPEGGKFLALTEANLSDWQLPFGKPDFLADAPQTANLEGFIFPDTYRVFNDATAEDIIKKSLDNFGKKLTPQMRDDISKQGKSIYEIIIMASIIEKEVRNVEDMKVVSGIFWNRIANGQALESCATLAYILGVDKKQYSYEDTQIKSSYNTYQNRGLTPGPISNPGMNAISAAIYPEKTDYNYFLTSSLDGSTIFSRTYEEHLRNKSIYLK